MMGCVATCGLLNFWLQIVIELMLMVFCIGFFYFEQDLGTVFRCYFLGSHF